MFVTIQFPFADVRQFVSSPTYRLPSPTWPLPLPNIEYVRASGVIRNRWRGGIEFWPGEESYCNARRAVRFQPSLASRPLGSLGRSWSIDRVFRRFTFDGEVVARMEIGLVIETGSIEEGFALDGQNCVNLIEALLSLPVRIPTSDGSYLYRQLSDCDQFLAKHYLRCTTRQLPES